MKQIILKNMKVKTYLRKNKLPNNLQVIYHKLKELEYKTLKL